VHNLRAAGEAKLQDGPVLKDYTVREVDGEEKARWWGVAMAEWPNFDDYQAATERVIPVFVLSPVD
jgi:deazaflavin-dependent oxidoreductase (nitroreductase family)